MLDGVFMRGRLRDGRHCRAGFRDRLIGDGGGPHSFVAEAAILDRWRPKGRGDASDVRILAHAINFPLSQRNMPRSMEPRNTRSTRRNNRYV
jgi:hypothetical protein